MKGRVPEGLPPQHMGDAGVTDAYATLLLAWLENRLTEWRWLTATSGRLAGVGTCPEPHRDKGNAKGTFQLYPLLQLSFDSPWRAAAQRPVVCPVLHRMKLGPLSVRAKGAFKGPASTTWVAQGMIFFFDLM